MNEQIRQIADRIRGLRDIAQLSVETCAQDLGIPVETYRRYESGDADIPASFLYQIAGKFHVELSSLLTGEEPRLRVYSVTRAGRGVKVDRRKDYGYQSLAFNFVDKKMEPFLITVDPRPESERVPLNAHPGQEFNYMLEGTLMIVVDSHEILLSPGDSIYFDARHSHGMKAIGGQPVRFLAVIL
ncbi:MAG: cupin domain-containing protein [Spirochaetia bacterium]|jgi:mannose-6-phosphate isomerase-like protein (cupin superfamily)